MSFSPEGWGQRSGIKAFQILNVLPESPGRSEIPTTKHQTPLIPSLSQIKFLRRHPQERKTNQQTPFTKLSIHRTWAAPPQSPSPYPRNPPKTPTTPQSDPTKAPPNSAPAPLRRGAEPNTNRTGPRAAASKPAAQGQTVKSDRCTRCTSSKIRSVRRGGTRGRGTQRRGCL